MEEGLNLKIVGLPALGGQVVPDAFQVVAHVVGGFRSSSFPQAKERTIRLEPLEEVEVISSTPVTLASAPSSTRVTFHSTVAGGTSL